MASVVLSGDTSGSITIAAPAVAGSTTQTLVNVTGTLAPIVSGTAKVAVTDFTTSADFTGIPSWVKRITVMFNGISLSGTDAILIRLGDSGGLETTGYISTSTGFTGAAGSTANNTTGFVVQSDTAAYLISGIVVITNISGNTWVESGSGKLSTAASWICGGDKTLSDTLTQISITRTGTNTFDAGSINLLWE